MKNNMTKNQELLKNQTNHPADRERGDKGLKGWREYSLEQFAILVKDIYKPNGKDDQKYIGLEHIEQETLRLNSVGNSTDVISNKFLFQANDILFGKLRPYFRKVIKPKFSGICSTDIWVLRAKEGFSQEFLFYFIANWDFVDIASSGEGGTRMPRADWDFLCKTRWLLPPLPEQKAIAAVLSSLDDKIDLLHRQNKTLEAMAETLFRQWFVEPCKNGLPEGWEEKRLGDYVDCINGVSYKGSDLNTSDCALVTLKNFDPNGGFRLDGFKCYTGKYKEEQIVCNGDLAVAHTDITQDASIIGNPIYIIDDPKYKTLVISMDLVKVNPKHSWLSKEFLYLLMKTSDFKEHCLGLSNGSTVLHLSRRAVPSYVFKMPPRVVIEEFTKIVKSIFSKMNKNIGQIRTLEKLRDLLLPKLMSGEVRVEYNGD